MTFTAVRLFELNRLNATVNVPDMEVFSSVAGCTKVFSDAAVELDRLSVDCGIVATVILIRAVTVARVADSRVAAG